MSPNRRQRGCTRNYHSPSYLKPSEIQKPQNLQPETSNRCRDWLRNHLASAVELNACHRYATSLATTDLKLRARVSASLTTQGCALVHEELRILGVDFAVQV